MPVTSVTPSSVLPLTLADANDHLRNLYPEETTHLTRLIEAATDWIEAILGMHLIDATVVEAVEGWKGNATVTPLRGPLSSVTAVKYFDSDSNQQTWAASNYLVTATNYVPGTIEVAPDITLPAVDGRKWPWEITYVAGFGTAETDVPDKVQHAVRVLVEDFDRNRGETIPNSISNKQVAIGVRRLLGATSLGRL